ncbi:60S acidic ribosomal protein P1-like [Arvicola amphibius]|uniref:60S acidic ribosomal protein P1-like n=1 Tax=Arvicola amphibius TaxID=1047088 RepID=UPI001C09ADE7|nr:60S acidic ribosomal protein P1-like [Arvicola amphibius]
MTKLMALVSADQAILKLSPTWPPWKLTRIYSALILQEDEVMVGEDKINVLIKATGVNIEPFWPSLFAKALANVNIGSLICNIGAGGPAPVAGAAPTNPAPSTAAAPADKRVEAKKEESEESEDNTNFGLFD